MEWTQLTQAVTLEAMPTAVISSKSLKAAYDAWIVADTTKVGRLNEIRLNILNRVRDAIVTNRANTLPEDAETIPRSCVQAALDLIWHALAMEMGLDISNAGSQAMVRSDLFVRQIAYGHFVVENSDTAPSPAYTIPAVSRTRALPTLIAWLVLLLAPISMAGWIDSSSTMYDSSVQATYVPNAYSVSVSTVYGHLQGINSALAGLQSIEPTFSGLMTNPTIYANSAGQVALFQFPSISKFGQLFYSTVRGFDLTINSDEYTRQFWDSYNDGPGSLLDADLLDGLTSTEFVRTNYHGPTSNTSVRAGSVVTKELVLEADYESEYTSPLITWTWYSEDAVRQTSTVYMAGYHYGAYYSKRLTIRTGTDVVGVASSEELSGALASYPTLASLPAWAASLSNAWFTNVVKYLGAAPTYEDDPGTPGCIKGDGGTNFWIHNGTRWIHISGRDPGLPNSGG